jgi:hypothetical protein
MPVFLGLKIKMRGGTAVVYRTENKSSKGYWSTVAETYNTP